MTALCTLALLYAGAEVDDLHVKRALDFLRRLEPEMTYATSLQTMVFCTAGLERDRPIIQRNVAWLENTQLKAGGDRRPGSWAYSGAVGNGDNSNTQFALLALHEADRVGITAKQRTWQRGLDYWLSCQKTDGSWGYYKGHPATGSMTCAGISSLIITMDKLDKFNRDATVFGDRVRCCGERTEADKLELALQWMGAKFKYDSNPVPDKFAATSGQLHLLYYYYGIERVGRLSGQRFLGKHDWYRKISERLVGTQDALTGHWKGSGHAEREPHIATSLALLFLSKGRWPVVMSKYKYSDDDGWNLHRRGVHNLAQSLEHRWKQPLTWQTIDAKAASVDDLLETPILFISGRTGIELAAEQKETLRDYINQGGFIFAEACNGQGCDGEEFDTQFRALMSELFPDSELRRLPPDHPVWFAERKVLPTGDRWLWGLDACCRTSVVYCPSNLSCYWELARAGSEKKYSTAVHSEIDRVVAMGQNVVAYATNRQVKAKLERPKALTSDTKTNSRTRGMLRIAKLSHGGGSDDAPNALTNLLRVARHELKMHDSIDVKKFLVAPDDPALYEFPILFVHGRREFRFTSPQRRAIATYLERGGFIVGDAICASAQFANSFRRELAAMFPDNPVERIPVDDPIFSHEFRGYDLKSVTLRQPHTGGDGESLRAKLSKTQPILEGLKIDDRYAVVFSPYDISCAMENHASLECKGYIKEDAAKIGLNILLYALQQ